MLDEIWMNMYIWSHSTDESDSDKLIAYFLCIGCMLDFTSGNYVYFNYNKGVSKTHHNIFILNQESDFTITSQLKLLEEKLLSFPKLFKEWLNRGLLKISKLLLSYQNLIYAKNIEKKPNIYIYIGREDRRNILGHVDFTRSCNVISQYTELNHDISKEDINFPPSVPRLASAVTLAHGPRPWRGFTHGPFNNTATCPI